MVWNSKSGQKDRYYFISGPCVFICSLFSKFAQKVFGCTAQR